MSDVEILMQEYFQLKEADKAIRRERNEFMAHNECYNFKESKDCEDQSDYEANGGDCIDRLRASQMGCALCPTCEKRNGWYMERQKNSHRRSLIMQMVKRRVAE